MTYCRDARLVCPRGILAWAKRIIYLWYWTFYHPHLQFKRVRICFFIFFTTFALALGAPKSMAIREWKGNWVKIPNNACCCKFLLHSKKKFFYIHFVTGYKGWEGVIKTEQVRRPTNASKDLTCRITGIESQNAFKPKKVSDLFRYFLCPFV